MTGVSVLVYSVRTVDPRSVKEAVMEPEKVGAYDVPVDPMDMLQCDSCQ
jgi:hypothetical protein